LPKNPEKPIKPTGLAFLNGLFNPVQHRREVFQLQSDPDQSIQTQLLGVQRAIKPSSHQPEQANVA